MEKEVKITLKTKDDYDKLIKYIENDKNIKSKGTENQVNTLYTNDYLKSHKIAIRIRTIDNAHTLTIKVRKEISDGYFVSDETNIALNENDLANFETQFAIKLAPDSLQKDLKALNDQKALVVEKYFALKTTRKVYETTFTQAHDSGNQQFMFLLEIDHVYDPLDLYELECETENPEEYKAYILDIFQKLQIQYCYSTKTKLEVVRNHLGLK